METEEIIFSYLKGSPNNTTENYFAIKLYPYQSYAIKNPDNEDLYNMGFSNTLDVDVYRLIMCN